MEGVVVGLGAYVNGDELVQRSREVGFTSSYQVRAGSAHCVFDDVRYEGSQEDGDDEA